MPRICTESLRLATVWPLPALLSWLLAWAAFSAMRAANLPEPLVFTAATAIGAAFSLIGNTACRRFIIAGGFPVSMLAGGAADGVQRDRMVGAARVAGTCVSARGLA